jgi:hypothetical protein
VPIIFRIAAQGGQAGAATEPFSTPVGTVSQTRETNGEGLQWRRQHSRWVVPSTLARLDPQEGIGFY